MAHIHPSVVATYCTVMLPPFVPQVPPPPLHMRITNRLRQQVVIERAIQQGGVLGDIATSAQVQRVLDVKAHPCLLP